MPEQPPVERLLQFIDAAPTPYHAVEQAAALLVDAGFTALHRSAEWPEVGGRHFVAEGGMLVAWVDEGRSPTAGFRLFGAHTDSPNLRVKAKPDTGRVGWRQLGVEVYGGALVNSWLDRDLGVSGRVAVRDDAAPGGYQIRLLHLDRPLVRIPQLAIHLDREINERGLQLNKQSHLVPVWGLGDPVEGDLVGFVAAELGVGSADVLSWDLMLHDVVPSTVAGVDDDLVFAPRLDNLCSCHSGIEALVRAGDHGGVDVVPVVSLFDHEEIGSTSSTGAAGTILAQVLERSVLARSGSRAELLQAVGASLCVSADMAHATHPNYPERHEPAHHISVNAGPVVKINANQRYASDATSIAAFELACERAGVPTQRYIHRTDLACGSTIGPMTAAGLAVPTVDVGVPQLSMHSIRELCGTDDPPRLTAAAAEVFVTRHV